eukprot:1187731-Prorocentrum_minimum.AAC.1
MLPALDLEGLPGGGGVEEEEVEEVRGSKILGSADIFARVFPVRGRPISCRRYCVCAVEAVWHAPPPSHQLPTLLCVRC